jgi:hypothetical protein
MRVSEIRVNQIRVNQGLGVQVNDLENISFVYYGFKISTYY